MIDPPHLLKGVRNNLLTKDIEINYCMNTGKDKKEYASWDVIQNCYFMDNPDGIHSMMRKITDQHIIPHRIKKMRVKNAAEVFSKTMAAFIFHHIKVTCK